MAPVFRNPVTLPDDQLATQALQILGAHVSGASATCNACHGLTRQHLRYWRALTRHRDGDVPDRSRRSTTQQSAHADDRLHARDARRRRPPTSRRRSSASTRPRRACRGSSRVLARVRRRRRREARRRSIDAVGMPKRRRAPPLTQDAVRHRRRVVRARPAAARRDARRRSGADDVHAGDLGATSPRTSPRWRRPAGARSTATNAMAMFGCGAATDPKQCLQPTRSRSTQPYGAGWDVAGHGTLRVLAGRHVHHVVLDAQLARRPVRRARRRRTSPARTSIDLQRDATIAIDAALRPGVLPRQHAASCSRAATRNIVRDQRADVEPDEHHDDRAGVHDDRRDRPVPARRPRARRRRLLRHRQPVRLRRRRQRRRRSRDPRRRVRLARLRRLHADDVRRHEVRRRRRSVTIAPAVRG